ncbi:MAG: serine hydrolase [Pseudomonadota bacterium]
MKLLLKLVGAFVALILIAILALQITGHGYILTALQRTYLAGHVTANIDDYRQFDTRTIARQAPQAWPEHAAFAGDALPQELDTFLSTNQAVAFLVIHQGQVLAEKYYDGYGPTSRTNSFSMAKSVVTMLLGAAIDDGIVAGVDEPLIRWLPEFADDPLADDVTLGNLSRMDSGFDWDEHYYSPFSPTVALLYSNDVGQFLFDRQFKDAPGESFYYSSASTQLLAMALSRALDEYETGLTLATYLGRKFWQPLGMNDDAVWHLDGTGQELGYCCISASARNFAKLGQLLLQDGGWNGVQLLAADWIEQMRTPAAVDYYGYSLWLNNEASVPHYALRGHLGQYVIVVPSLDLVIVRLGHQIPQGYSLYDDLLPFYIDQARQLIPDT